MGPFWGAPGYVPWRIWAVTHMYSLVYIRVHVCTSSYTSGYMYVPTRIRQGTQMYSVICSWVLNLLNVYHLKSIVYRIWPLKFTIYRIENKSLSIGLAIYYWAIFLALCFGCFRLSAIFPVVVSVLRRYTITVLLYDTEATHCPYHGNYPCTVHVIVYGHCLYVNKRKLFPGTTLVSSMVQPRKIPRVPLYDHTARGDRSNNGNCPWSNVYDLWVDQLWKILVARTVAWSIPFIQRSLSLNPEFSG